MNTEQLVLDAVERGKALGYAEGMKSMKDKIRQQQRTIDGDKRLIDLLYEKVEKQQAEIAELKHINRNWQISEGMALAEIEALKEPKIPLLEQEIKFILGNGQCWQGEDCSMPNLMYIIRAVEAAHGIGVKQDEQ